LFKSSLSGFDRVFARFANDLKFAAEQTPDPSQSSDTDSAELREHGQS
jgi:hypothetical protein